MSVTADVIVRTNYAWIAPAAPQSGTGAVAGLLMRVIEAQLGRLSSSGTSALRLPDSTLEVAGALGPEYDLDVSADLRLSYTDAARLGRWLSTWFRPRV